MTRQDPDRVDAAFSRVIKSLVLLGVGAALLVTIAILFA
jgi:hypothetical protein